MIGLAAYNTYRGMSAHFSKKYDGWKYNFKVKSISDEKFNTLARIKYQYAAIERDHPNTTRQIMYMYPAFATNQFIKPENTNLFRVEYTKFIKKVMDLDSYTLFITDLVGKLTKVDDLFAGGTLPAIFHLLEGCESHHTIILFMVIPELNKIVGKEEFVFEKWKTEVEFHRKFYSLYIDNDTLKQYKSITINTLKKIQ